MNLKEKYQKYKKTHQEKDRPVSRRMLQTLMDNIDFETTLMRLGISAKPCNNNGEYCGYCPDHEMFKGVAPSDPKWYINAHTGLTYCQTESRGSNLIEIAKRLLGVSTNQEAFEKLLDGKPIEIKFVPKVSKEPEEKELPNQEKLKQSLEEVEPIFEKGIVSKECVEYFARDGITLDTINKYGITSCNYGRYKNRALVPFLDKNLDLVGYIAIDLLGKERWAEEHAKYHMGIDSSKTFEELYPLFLKKYKKTLYAPGFLSRQHLYGFYENLSFLETKHDYLVLVEGERDALKLIQEGIPCVSVHGTYIKEEQRLLLKTSGVLGQIKELFLGFDMDKAGDEATVKAKEIFSKEIDEDKIYVLNFPEGKDPKKFCREELLAIIQNSRENNIHSR